MISVYTDASFRRDHRGCQGAYAFVIKRGDDILYEESRKILNQSTNNLCETVAVIHAIYHLRLHHPDDECVIYTDSQYVISGASKRLSTHKALWDLFYDLKSANIHVEKVKAHSGNKDNNYVDRLAYKKLNE